MSATTSRIDSHGQVTIPKEIRQQLGLHEGDSVEFTVEGSRTVLTPTTSNPNVFTPFIGIAPAFRSLDEINSWVADMRGSDDAE